MADIRKIRIVIITVSVLFFAAGFYLFRLAWNAEQENETPEQIAPPQTPEQKPSDSSSPLPN